ncbi:MAG: VWA domain-containing protein [Fibrobacteres bacterium]|nr:VWA domain-containing protein [Fibrobacterota bacterium]
MGSIAFAADTGHVRPPLLLSVAGNPALIKASLQIDSIPDTQYGPPLKLAAKWLRDTSLTNTAKQAIVFISDGQPNDANAVTTWINANKDIPIYTIALGDSTAPFTRMQDMSTQTGGVFYRVSPKDLVRMNVVMQQIIQAITVPTIPRSIEVTNTSLAPPQVSRSTGMNRNADSSITPVMDSILALNKGANVLTVKVTMSDNDVRNYTVKVQADGPVAAASGQSLSCYAMPTLTLLNKAGGVDSAYTAATTQYNVRLTRATSDLKQVIVTATSSDTTRPGWGDEEHIILPEASAAGGTTVNLKNNYPLNGSAATATKGDNTLDAAPGPGGSVTLTWQHPRDPREIATYRLPGKSISTTQGFIDVIRAVDAPHGVDLPVVTDPVVIRGGVTLVQKGGSAVLTSKGDLNNPNKISGEILDPNHTPTFVFKTAAPFSYSISIYDGLGQFLNSKEGAVDSLKWEQLRGGADSLACAFSILPVSKEGHRFGTGVYILRATITTHVDVRQDVGRPARVTAATKTFTNRFGYIR